MDRFIVRLHPNKRGTCRYLKSNMDRFIAEDELIGLMDDETI